MYKVISIILAAFLCLSCINKKDQPALEDDSTIYNTYTGFFKDRDLVLGQLKQPGLKKLNIDNLFEISIPESMEIFNINQRLILDTYNPRYYVIHNLEMIYHNKYFILNITCYGDNNSIISGKETFNLQTITAGIASQITILQNNYFENPYYNQNNVKLSKMVAGWGSHWSSDIFGVYFTLNDNYFNECEITFYNSWGSFTNIDVYQLNEENYRTKSTETGGIIADIIKDLDLIENSITFSISDDSINIITGNIGDNNTDFEYILPAGNNIRLRRTPSLTGEILGYMQDRIYNVIKTGTSEEIDGINGNWVMILPVPYKFEDVAWVFNGYTRNATMEELNLFFDGE